MRRRKAAILNIAETRDTSLLFLPQRRRATWTKTFADSPLEWKFTRKLAEEIAPAITFDPFQPRGEIEGERMEGQFKRDVQLISEMSRYSILNIIDNNV